MKRRIQFLAISLAATLVLGHAAQADSPFSVDVWNTEDRLPENSVIALTQTHDGYLWLGTLNGLVRFDGNSFTPFNVNNTGLPSDRIVFLFEDSKHILWVGTETAGLCAIQNGVVKNFDTGGGGIITAAFEDENDVWFATSDRNFFCWRNGSLERNPKIYPAQLQFLIYRAFHLIVPEKNGGSWQLQNGRVEKWRGDTLEKNLGALPWGSAVVTTACEDDDGNLIVGTRGDGVYWFEAAGNFRHITKDDGLSENYILSLCFDSEKNLWVGTDGGGLDRVKRKIFSRPDGLAGGVALSAAEDEQGGLWASFNLRGLTYWRTNAAQHFSVGADSKAGPVLKDARQQIWVGTSGEGLFRLVARNFEHCFNAEPIGGRISVLFAARDGKLWVGGDAGLGSFDGTNWNFYSAAAGLPQNPIRALAENAQGDLWIGTENGLFESRAGKIFPLAAPVNDISCLLADGENGLWAGTSGHGLAHLQNGKWTTFTEDDGLVNDIGYLIEDDSQNLWIGSYEGLMRVGKKSLADFVSRAGEKISARIFLTRECSAGAQPAALRAHDGKLWFPTIEGLVSVNPAELKPNTNPPPMIIESILVDGVPQKNNPLDSRWPSSVTLTPGNEQLDIHFTALNFSAPKRAKLSTRFQYKLEGYEKNWTDAGDSRVAHFPKLPPGHYVFRVLGCNEDGVWNTDGASVAIVVQPPFWRTWWFLTLALLTFIALLAGIIYLISTQKLRRQLRAAKQKELIERERARIARDLHDQLGANLTQVTLLGEMAEMDKNSPAEVELHAQQICVTARETTHALDEIVWAVNPSNDTLEGLANYACKYAQDYFALAGVSFRAELPHDLPATPILPEVRHNIFLAFKEAVNNVVKHAQATEARVKLQLEPGRFILSVEDNGRGVADVSEKTLRNGLKNMRKRLADVHGEFEISSGANGGTIVRLIVPVDWRG